MKRLGLVVVVASLGAWSASGRAATNAGEDAAVQCYEQFRSGDMNAAIALCTKAIESGQLDEVDLVSALINRGVAFRNIGQYQRAVVDYTEALHRAPGDAMIYANRANARRELGELRNALNDANKAIELDSRRPASYYTRGAVLEAAGQLRNARKDYMMALSLAPSNIEYQNKILLLDAKLAQGGEGKRP
jgi:tetratricopeptide (TPR) repeat protein